MDFLKSMNFCEIKATSKKITYFFRKNRVPRRRIFLSNDFCHLRYSKIITDSSFFLIKLNKYCFLTFNSNLHMVMLFPFWRMLPGTILN